MPARLPDQETALGLSILGLIFSLITQLILVGCRRFRRDKQKAGRSKVKGQKQSPGPYIEMTP